MGCAGDGEPPRRRHAPRRPGETLGGEVAAAPVRCGSGRTNVARMATCAHPSRGMVGHVGLANAGSRHPFGGDSFPDVRRHPVRSPSWRKPRRPRTSGSGTPESWCGKETWLLVHRREPERTYRTCRCVKHRQGRGGRGASNRRRRFVRSSGSHPMGRTQPSPTQDGRRRTRSMAQATGPRPDPTTRAKRPWKPTDSQVLRPERKTQSGAPDTSRMTWRAPGRRTIGLAPVGRGAHGSTDERRERHTVHRASIGNDEDLEPSGTRPAEVHGSYSGREMKGMRGWLRREHFRSRVAIPETTQAGTPVQGQGGSA